MYNINNKNNAQDNRTNDLVSNCGIACTRTNIQQSIFIFQIVKQAISMLTYTSLRVIHSIDNVHHESMRFNDAFPNVLVVSAKRRKAPERTLFRSGRGAVHDVRKGTH